LTVAKLKILSPLRKRLRALLVKRDDQKTKAGDNKSWAMAVELQYKIRCDIERWIEDNRKEDAADISNALLAVSTDVLETGLRCASEDPTVRGAVIGRYLTQFTHNAIEAGLIKPPVLPPQQQIAENAIGRSLLGPDGKPYKVQ
jgi:hypothetical protein